MDAPITHLNEDVARSTLQVLSYVCSDRQVDLAEGTGRQDDRLKGHHMSYREAISSIMDSIPTFLIMPPPILSKKRTDTRTDLR